MPTALVTGGAGRIGSELCRHLAEANYAVRAFDLPSVDYSYVTAHPGVEAAPGELTNSADVAAACTGVDLVVHLAALLPPVSEQDRDRTMSVNVDGTRIVTEQLAANAPQARLLFSSSVVVYGDTSGQAPPVAVTAPADPRDIYAESKVAAEAVVRAGGLSWTIARIAGVANAAVLEPPDPWPFTADQRLEFVLRDDVADALARLATAPNLDGCVVHVSGGDTWRMTGERYAGDYLAALGLPAELAGFLPTPLAFDWYAPAAELSALGFRPTPYDEYLRRLQGAVQEFIEGADDA